MDNIHKMYRETTVVSGTVAHDADLVEDTAAMMLGDDGIITNCNEACVALFGCKPSEVIGQHISEFLPQIQAPILFKDHHLNPHLRFLSRIGHHFQGVMRKGTIFTSKVFFVELGNTCESFIRVIIRPVEPESVYS